ncbi:MAG: zinc ribbon domain-containing protein [Proteobacteria bacterium]|nr:zinc ribbon domain-containing protein [Pseudomonadota bacterium]
MPIYEYICEHCEEEVEVIQKISEEPLTQCPSCSENTLKKKTSMSAFHLKGGGWYKDGYGNSNGDTSASNNGNSSSNNDSSSSNGGSNSNQKESTDVPAKSDSPTTSSNSNVKESPKSSSDSDKKAPAKKNNFPSSKAS